MSIKLYYDLLSQPSRALYILLHKANVQFIKHPIALQKGEHLSDEFKEVSRMQKLPVLDHAGFKLSESIAIVRYLANENKLPDHWYPKNSRIQARVNEYLSWQHTNTRALCFLYFQKKFLIPLITGEPADDAKIEPYRKRMSDCLDSIETLWLSSGDFICGDSITVADLFAACEIEQPRIAGYEPTKGRPILTAWLERVKKETSPFYEQAHIFVNKAATGGIKFL